MAGHSKWANIQHRKKSQDAKRGKLFTKLIREITVAARTGGGEAASNPRLRAAIDKALVANMTKDTVERAIKRGTGAGDDAHYEEIRYEGYGPGGVAIMVDCMTDNRNRTVSEVRHAFSKFGGNLGTDGSVSYLFTKIGMLTYAAGSDEERIMEVALDAGADDVVVNADGSIDVFTAADDMQQIKERMTAAGQAPAHADVTMHPATSVSLDGEAAQSVLKMIDLLDDLDDVQNVYSNGEFPLDMAAE